MKSFDRHTGLEDGGRDSTEVSNISTEPSLISTEPKTISTEATYGSTEATNREVTNGQVVPLIDEGLSTEAKENKQDRPDV